MKRSYSPTSATPATLRRSSPPHHRRSRQPRAHDGAEHAGAPIITGTVSSPGIYSPKLPRGALDGVPVATRPPRIGAILSDLYGFVRFCQGARPRATPPRPPGVDPLRFSRFRALPHNAERLSSSKRVSFLCHKITSTKEPRTAHKSYV